MAHDYAEKKMREALVQSGGNATQAQRILIEWALDDQILLIALTQHHLKGIVAHAIERTISKDKPEREKISKPQTKPEPIDMPPESFGRDLLKALSGRNSIRFGLEGASGRPIVTRRKQASQQHIDALKSMSSIPPKES